ncbi:23S rRNA (adenine(2503)-C(2))-methyltransferase @ tRNA (adenine(37)-C(2))-methyltransferase [hydrothermal vent metagenome]|uniref:23S rRNA (Adenine(2503)-C(2))-methyltransferase @ tRNA (Adenine(37)-C(2))-methyltransferase n=1 Tax=hydrothermal vent metagenome TaxID=652676 RepID=A0A3B0SZD2_9ZZZZ
MAAADKAPALYGLDRMGMTEALAALNVPASQLRMRVGQLWNWTYVRGATDFSQMTTIGKDLRAAMASVLTLERPEIVSEQVSTDGTRKWLLRFAPGPGEKTPAEVETVYIPEEARGTLCLSSQVGCTLNCSFCHTGTQKLVRNLTTADIVGQIMVARDRLGDWRDAGKAPEQRLVTNVVMMGMGEPLYNFDEVARALLIASDGEGLSISKRRITLSTSGVVPMIDKVGSDIGVRLAISLHGVTDEVRDILVPINRKYPIADLMAACRRFPGLSNAKRITFEYVMLKGINDSPADARRLVALLRGIPAKINLIPFNPWPGSPYECSDWDVIERFSDIVARAGYASPVRSPRGRDIMAACGQLKSESEKLTAKERQADT